MDWNRLTPRVPQALKDRFTPRVLRRAGVAAAGAGTLLALAATAGAGGQPGAHSPAPVGSDRVPASAPAPGHVTKNLLAGPSTFETANGKTFKISLTGETSTSKAETAQSAKAKAISKPQSDVLPKATHKPTSFATLKKGTTFIDVSKWQGNIDFNKLYKSGVRTVTIKAGFGANDPDPMFDTNMRDAIKAGMNVNLTVWVVPNQNAKAQAHFAATERARIIAKYHPKNDPQIFWDVEDAVNGASMSDAAHVAELQAEMLEYAKETHEPVSNGVLYTGGPFWNEHYNSNLFGPAHYNLNGVDANYNWRPGQLVSSLPLPNGVRVNVIQWTSGAHLPGIPDNSVDLDRVVAPMHGTELPRATG